MQQPARRSQLHGSDFVTYSLAYSRSDASANQCANSHSDLSADSCAHGGSY